MRSCRRDVASHDSMAREADRSPGANFLQWGDDSRIYELEQNTDCCGCSSSPRTVHLADVSRGRRMRIADATA